jgi:hypothetical protein
MLDLFTTLDIDSIADNGIVIAQNFLGFVIADPLRERRRSFHVRKENSERSLPSGFWDWIAKEVSNNT